MMKSKKINNFRQRLTMSEFQVFVNYTWPFFVMGLMIRVFCWMIAYCVDLIHTGVGDDAD